jgi:hypothetical protein
MNRLEIIHQLIELYKLTDKTRKREIIYKRFFIYNELRQAGLTFSQIGEIFGKNHATIMYGISVQNDLLRFKDAVYLAEIETLKQALGDSKFPNVKKLFKGELGADLKRDVMLISTMPSLKRLKRRIKMGYYENSFQQIEQEAE